MNEKLPAGGTVTALNIASAPSHPDGTRQINSRSIATALPMHRSRLNAAPHNDRLLQRVL